MLDAVLADHPGGQSIMDLFSVSATGLLMGYFAYLIIIRKTMGQKAG
jgi:hypothetical protein